MLRGKPLLPPLKAVQSTFRDAGFFRQSRNRFIQFKPCDSRFSQHMRSPLASSLPQNSCIGKQEFATRRRIMCHDGQNKSSLHPWRRKLQKQKNRFS
jgi:hypothetical protein